MCDIKAANVAIIVSSRAREVQPVKHKSHEITVLYYDRVKTRKIFDMGISNLRARAPTCGDLIRNPECEET